MKDKITSQEGPLFPLQPQFRPNGQPFFSRFSVPAGEDPAQPCRSSSKTYLGLRTMLFAYSVEGGLEEVGGGEPVLGGQI